MPLAKIIDYRLLYKASALYYEKGLMQSEIGNRLSISRTKVSRLLKQAEEVGIVKHVITPLGGVNTDIEDKLESRFNLTEAVVVEVSDPDSEKAILREIGSAAALFFHRVLSDPCIIGMAWGKAMREMVDNFLIHDLSHSELVQLNGGLGSPESDTHITYILRKAVDQLGCKLSILNLPGIVDTLAAKDIMMSDSHVKEVFDMFPKIDRAFVGIGDIEYLTMSNINKLVSKKELNNIMTAGAVGEICLRFFNIEGKLIPSTIDDRVIGISLDELKTIHHVTAVAGGHQKVKSIIGALNGGLINALVTDRNCAISILENTET